MSMKKKVSQNDLRKALNEHKKKLIGVKKVDSPLAKYLDSGQLMCILCQSIVRSESTWPIHLTSQKHKENVELAKKSKLESVQVPKRPSSEISEVIQKKPKLQEQVKHNKVSDKIPDDFFDKKPTTKPNIPLKKKEDVQTENISTVAKKSEETKKEVDNCLPEGFFDDPVLDARVRNVEYKNPIDDEWERFQREMQEENAQSAQIIAEDQEESTAERQLEEIDEQIHNWSRVMELVKLKESVQREEKKAAFLKDDAISEDEIEYDEEMDWRAKKSVR